MILETVSGSILGKIIDTIVNLVINFLVYALKIISPIKITPKKIVGQNNTEWDVISTIKIENRMNKDIYDVTIIGASKDIFDVTIISDNSPKGKTVQHMDLNANHISVHAKDERSGNYLWIFRIQKLAPKEKLVLNVKINNKTDIFLGLSRYSKTEIPIKERRDGAVAIPFQIGKIPKIK